MTQRPTAHDHDEARRREALDTLDKLRRDRAPLAGSSLAEAARRAGRHFAAADAVGPDGARDPIELWGRRIGRALSLLAVIALSIYLYLTYLR
jgi:cytochrome c-type biogenesis protein CcmH/NrfG